MDQPVRPDSAPISVLLNRATECLHAGRPAQAILALQEAGGNGDAAAVLIMGLPRSGTTLVEQILSSHPQVHGGGELPFWTERGARWEASLDVADTLNCAVLGAEYLNLPHALAPQAIRVTDKMPLNILWAGLIRLVLPRATLIHCRRAAIDVAMNRGWDRSRLSLRSSTRLLSGQ